jgi:hypothetical protein
MFKGFCETKFGIKVMRYQDATVQKITQGWYIWYKIWHNKSEVVLINASDFFKKVYLYLNNQKNQGVFVTNCFIAAGSFRYRGSRQTNERQP